MRIAFNIKLLFGLVAAFLSGCGESGPSIEEQKQVYENRVKLEQLKEKEALETFANKFSAHQVKPFEYGCWGTTYTANIQKKYENKPIAFQGSLLDVIQNKNGTYVAVFGKYFGSATTFNLTLSNDLFEKIMSEKNDRTMNIYAAAKIFRVLPINLYAKVCSEPGCNEVEIAVQKFKHSFHVSGSLLGYEVIQQP